MNMKLKKEDYNMDYDNEVSIEEFDRLWRDYYSTIPPFDNPKLSAESRDTFKEFTRTVVNDARSRYGKKSRYYG